jgi:uroporphyrinogen decarboxylase
VDFPEDEPARYTNPCLSDLAQARDLTPPDLAKHPRVQIWLEGVRLIKAHFGDAIYVRGNCDQCPYSLAGSLRGQTEWMMDLMDEDRHPDAFRLLDHCLAITSQFLRLMAATGADMLSNGDSPAGPDMVSPAIYRRFALPWERKIAEQAHALGKPYVLHICGNTTSILEDMLETGSDGYELDYKTDVALIHARYKDRALFIGNLDPSSVLALGSVELVQQKTRELLDLYRDSPRFILNAGCALPSTTPSENLRAMIRLAHSQSYRTRSPAK